jgi:ferredoxin-fold anticodon binding domain-containing protein
MENLIKGDKIVNIIDKQEYIVDYVETVGDISVVFTDDTHCKCIPLKNVKKIAGNLLASYFIKLFNGEKLTENEENDLTNRLVKLNTVTISPFEYRKKL